MNYLLEMSKSPILFSSDDEDEGLCKEAEVLKKFQMMLQGIPPPSSVTMSKLSVCDMLQKYKENECLYSISHQKINNSHKCNTNNKTTPKFISCLNSSKTSEEIANLFQKIQSRYIYSETMSSCNIWFDTVVETNSAKKRSGHRNGFGLSPGSRLSHLARRRQIFSCENLQQLANSDKRRQIEIKKGNTLKSRILERNKTVESVKTKANSFKRALFLSPDNEDTKKRNLSHSSIKRNLFPSSDKGLQICSGRTFPKEVFNQYDIEGSSKKRRRMESRDFGRNWPRKALTFSEDDSDKGDELHSGSAKVLSEVQLSLHHKSKLLWAVSVTLKEKNICSKDPHFKTCASALFMICRKNLGKILSSKREGGTSEKMIHFARDQIGVIFKRLGISKHDNVKEEQNADVAMVENNSNSESCSACTEEILDCCKDCKQVFCTKKNINNTNKSESALTVWTTKVQTNNYEKENMDISEKSNST